MIPRFAFRAIARGQIAALVLLALPLSVHAQQKVPRPASDVPPARQQYMGREIAQTMHYTGAQWLIRDTREREERCSLMVRHLELRKNMTVCDMGCGNGFYSLKLARLVGTDGQVLAVDIQPQMLYLLRTRAEQEGIGNITPILGSLHDPRLPKTSTDLVLMVDVYHEFSHPARMLAAMRRALKPGGVLVLLEYREEDPKVPIKPLHKMSKKQLLKEMTATGFKLVKQFDGLPWQHMMFFGRDDQWHASEDGKSEAPEQH